RGRNRQSLEAPLWSPRCRLIDHPGQQLFSWFPQRCDNLCRRLFTRPAARSALLLGGGLFCGSLAARLLLSSDVLEPIIDIGAPPTDAAGTQLKRRRELAELDLVGNRLAPVVDAKLGA